MIRLGLRLTLNGGREAAARLIIIVIAVAIGVGMLLIALAGINAVNAQNARYAWLETGAVPHTRASVTGTTGQSATDPVWWRLDADSFDGKTIGRIDVAITGPDSPVPPGIAQLPGPGQLYASPALSKLMRSTPAGQLRDRYPGTEIGTIGNSALPAPNSLIIIIGLRPDQLAGSADAERITSISTVVPNRCDGNCYAIGIDASGIDLVLSVASAALLFPVLIFIGTATRLSAARREQRFAAIRLVGATPAQISMIATVESTVAAVAGVAAGFGLFYLLRPVLAPIPFTGSPFFLSDLSLNPADILAVAIGVPVAAAVVARIALRRVQISPLGVTRRVTPRPPRAWRLIPLLAGIGELAYFVGVGRPASTAGQTRAYLTGFLVIMAGLVIAGPWLTMVCSRIMARRTNRVAVLIASRRLSDNPQAGFRAISGLILALFVTSVAVGVITTIVANEGAPTADTTVARGSLIDRSFGPDGLSAVKSVPASLLDQVRSTPGVNGVTVVRQSPDRAAGAPPWATPGLALCTDLATTPAFGRCASGATVAAVGPDFGDFGRNASTPASAVWQPADISPSRLAGLPVLTIAVSTDGSTAATEQVRTMLEVSLPALGQPVTFGEELAQHVRLLAQYQQLADVVILVSLPIAGCSLAVSITGGLNDRKRPFSLLRLTGAPLSLLRRVVVLESAVPLLLASTVAIGTGFLAAGLFLKSQLQYSLHAPSVQYYGIVLVGLLASLAIIASTLPLLDRITGPETARNE